MSRTIALISAFVMCVALTIGHAQGTQGARPTVLKAADSRFMMDAARAGMAEIDLATLADSKGEHPAVKQFAAKLKSDHEAAAEALKALAAQKDIALPSSVNAAQKATRTNLDKLSGAGFDRAYAAQMVIDHRQAVRMFTTASKSTDADVKSFAEKTLPTLKDHLQRALDLQKQVSGPARGK